VNERNGAASVASPGASVLLCASCGEGNALDSRFCRLCGALVRGDSRSADPQRDGASGATVPTVPVEAPHVEAPRPAETTVFDRGAAASAVAPATAAAPGSSAASDGGTNGSAVVQGRDAAVVAAASVPVGQAVDEARARHLLDRAFALAERGDMASAILSCRQSVALSPRGTQGFSMLGLLLERTGNLEQAATAYSRVLELAPGSRLEMESLERIRSTLDQRRNAPFHFDARDLEDAPLTSDTTPITAASAEALDATSSASPTAAPVVAAATAAVAAAPAAAVAAGPASRGAAPSLIVPAASTGASGMAPPALAPVQFDLPTAAPLPWWKQAVARPSAFSRGLPVACVVGLGLLFMIWARSSALSRYPQDALVPSNLDSTSLNGPEVPPLPGGSSDSTSTSAPVAVEPGSSSAPRPPGIAGPNDAYPVGNRPLVPPSNATAESASRAPGRVASSGAPGGGQPRAANPTSAAPRAPRPQPVFPPASSVVPPRADEPRTVAPASPSRLPPVRYAPSAPAPSFPAAPAPAPARPAPSSGLSSSGGGPIGPSTSGARGSITLSRPRYGGGAAPGRSSARAAAAESAAARAATGGRTDAAITNLNRAIEAGGDTGWRYQQRALAFLEAGDYKRAADDFQTAISAYRDQIERGERVAEARVGERACQSGLALALANLRR
jgi:tetratricopeptide (TPR) repeat protein